MFKWISFHSQHYCHFIFEDWEGKKTLRQNSNGFFVFTLTWKGRYMYLIELFSCCYLGFLFNAPVFCILFFLDLLASFGKFCIEIDENSKENRKQQQVTFCLQNYVFFVLLFYILRIISRENALESKIRISELYSMSMKWEIVFIKGKTTIYTK